MRKLTLTLLGLLTASAAFAAATLPSADKQGSKDSPLLQRYDGSVIVAYENQAFGELTLPLSRLEPVSGKKDAHNNRVHEPKNKKPLTGAYTRLVYLIPEGRSPLEVMQNYQQEIRGKGGRVLFTCAGADCGGDPGKSSHGGGGDLSLSMYLYPSERISEPSASPGFCAVARKIADQRYTAAEIPARGAHVSVLTYKIVENHPQGTCRAFNGRTIAVVDLVETKAREQRMVTVGAGEMAKAISATGRVALYGILFDFNKAEIRPQSEATLAEIAKLLKSSPGLNLLVVGHTDNVGSFDFNLGLSQRRAAAVVDALARRFGVSPGRLKPFGASFASPAAPNRTEEGRTKNRRVELVENSAAAAPGPR